MTTTMFSLPSAHKRWSKETSGDDLSPVDVLIRDGSVNQIKLFYYCRTYTGMFDVDSRKIFRLSTVIEKYLSNSGKLPNWNHELDPFYPPKSWVIFRSEEIWNRKVMKLKWPIYSNHKIYIIFIWKKKVGILPNWKLDITASPVQAWADSQRILF
jgi:hypothetical protein